MRKGKKGKKAPPRQGAGKKVGGGGISHKSRQEKDFTSGGYRPAPQFRDLKIRKSLDYGDACPRGAAHAPPLALVFSYAVAARGWAALTRRPAPRLLSLDKYYKQK